jgi:hypothetical protein
MTKLTRAELLEFAQIVVLANTPISLFRGMERCAGMDSLRKTPLAELVAYYDHLTARAKRNEIVIGLAYAILCAIIVQGRSSNQPGVDGTRLQWGVQIQDFMKRAYVGTESTIILTDFPRPTVSSTGSPAGSKVGSAPPAGLYAPNGQIL